MTNNKDIIYNKLNYKIINQDLAYISRHVNGEKGSAKLLKDDEQID